MLEVQAGEKIANGFGKTVRGIFAEHFPRDAIKVDTFHPREQRDRYPHDKC